MKESLLKMWYSCSKRVTAGCPCSASVVAWSEEQEDGSLIWHHRFETVSSYEVRMFKYMAQCCLTSMIGRELVFSTLFVSGSRQVPCPRTLGKDCGYSPGQDERASSKEPIGSSW